MEKITKQIRPNLFLEDDKKAVDMEQRAKNKVAATRRLTMMRRALMSNKSIKNYR